MNINVKLVRLSAFFTLFVVLALTARSQSQPIYSTPFTPAYSPLEILGNVAGSEVAREQLANQPDLSINGYWGSEGAIIASGIDGGNVAWNVTLGAAVSTTVAVNLSYHLDLINLDSDEAIIVIRYTETTSLGGASTGLIELRRIKRSHPNQTFPVDQGTGGASGVTLSPASANSGGGQGYWYEVSVPFTYAYISDGTLYVVEGYMTGNVWIPGGTVGGGRDKNHL